MLIKAVVMPNKTHTIEVIEGATVEDVLNIYEQLTGVKITDTHVVSVNGEKKTTDRILNNGDRIIASQNIDKANEGEMMNTEETTEITDSKKRLPVELIRNADAILSRFTREWLIAAILVRGKKEHAIEYILSDRINDELSSQKLLSTIYFGAEYKYGTATDKRSITIPESKAMVEKIFKSIPEDQLHKEVVVKQISNGKLKESAKNTVKQLKLAGLTLEAIKDLNSVKLTLNDEEIETAFNAN